MNLETKIMTALKEAMKSKDQAALRTLRSIKAALLLRQTDGSGTTISAAEEIKLLQKLAKQRKESIDIYQKQNRPDLAKIEEEELEIIERFLPEQMSDDKLKVVIEEIIDETGADSMKDMGKVMGLAQKRLAGKADGKKISSIVRKFLS